MTTWLCVLLGAAAAGAADGDAKAPLADRLAAPVRLEAGEGPIDADVGHATPFVCDFDGDGKRDLLVGQFRGGKLRLYRNVGTDAAPRFEGFEFVEADGGQVSVPTS